jgi:hypothetical protein
MALGDLRWMRFVTSAVALTLVALGLAGCVLQPPPTVPTSTPTVAPMFATDADALAAARTAYAGYLTASDAVNRNGGADMGPLVPWATEREIASDRQTLDTINRAHEHVVGHLNFYGLSLEHVEPAYRGITKVVVYVCLDVRDTKVLDSRGRDVTPTRSGVLPLEVTLDNGGHTVGHLQVRGSESWLGTDFC